MLKLTEQNGAVEFEVLAKPKASRNEVIGVHDGALKVAVTAPPEKGKANAAIVKLLADILEVPSSSIEIVSGETSRRKRVRIEGIDAADIAKLAGGS